MTITEKQRAFTLCLAELIYWAYVEKEWEIVIGEVERPYRMQEVYFKEGKSKTMNSKHIVRCAADLFLWINGEYRTDAESYKEMGEKWEELGKNKGLDLRWGGRFGVEEKDYATKLGWDANHFEIS